MINITVGQVSAAINAGTIIVQVTLPLTIVLLLVSVLGNRNNAITWSVIDRMLQRSLWPTILGSDSAATLGVQKRVAILSLISTIGTIMLLVAGVVTPLGLSEGIRSSPLNNPRFEYAPDISWFGHGSAPRGEYTISRLCGSRLLQSCPGQTSTNGLRTFRNDTTWAVDTANGTGWIDSRIPRNITEIFTSADELYGSGVANAFDIQYRSFEITRHNDSTTRNIDNGQPVTAGISRFLGSLLLNNRYDIVEGLIVDTKKGGVGFRNHTVPIHTSLGASWDETLLWMEPLTTCVSNNLTIDYTIADKNELLDFSNLRLTDHGGFMDTLARPVPPFINRDDSQTEPDLHQRASNGASYSNLLYAMYFNLTTKNITRRYGTTYRIPSNYDPSYESPPFPLPSSLDLWAIVQNPLDISFTAEFDIELMCTGFTRWDDANITNIAVHCGTILGTPERTDSHINDRSFMFEAGSSWKQSIYTCATTVKASLKRVSFFANGTDLASLEVTAISDISYTGNTPKPLWAVEKTGTIISELNPIWGLVDERYENHENLWTVRSSHLYPPAGNQRYLSASDSLASAGLYQGALHQTYDGGSLGYYDYNGGSSYAMFMKWQELSKSAQTVPTIPNLIWTDVMANSIVGTRSIHSHRNSGHGRGDPREVQILRRAISYNYIYAIPAAILLILWVILCLIAFILWISSRVTLSALRQLLNQTGTGRAVANVIYPDMETSTASTRHWIQTSGKMILELSNPNEDTELPVGSKTGGEIRTGPSGLYFRSVPQSDQMRPLL